MAKMTKSIREWQGDSLEKWNPSKRNKISSLVVLKIVL